MVMSAGPLFIAPADHIMPLGSAATAPSAPAILVPTAVAALLLVRRLRAAWWNWQGSE
jgi:hypothetical protein